MELLGIFFAAVLINNILLIRSVGMCSFFGVTTKIDMAVGMSFAVLFVVTVASAICWFFFRYLLVPFDLVFLKTVVFILVIASLVQLEELYLRKMIPSLYRSMGIYLPLITTNCAVLAVPLFIIDYKYDFIQAIIYSVGVCGGYTLSMVLLAYIRERTAISPIPRWFQGYPIAFVTAALMALAFLGFSGLFGL